MMEHGASYLIDILAILLATVIVVPVFHAIRLGAILGYLAAGMILGPWGLGAITEVDNIRHLGEFGIIFLLFVLGIELKPDKLWQMRRMVIGLGLGQLLLTAGVLFVIALLFGLSSQSALIIGFGLALSSTAFCLKLLSERGGISTLMGRMSLSVLLLQDLAVVPLLAMVSYLSGVNASVGTPFNLAYAVIVILLLLISGRYLLNPLMGKIVASQDPDVFVALAVLLVLGVAWLMKTVGLSMELGAFLAGVMIAESHYRHQIEADILPFRGILLGLFFMTVGMGIDFGILTAHFVEILVLTLGLMTIKAVIVFMLARVSGARNDVAIQTGVLLSQSGEFGFVLFGFAAVSGAMEDYLGQFMTLVVALSMVLTPFVVMAANYLLLRFYKPDLAQEHYPYTEFIEDSEAHVIVAGFGRVGARIGALLSAAGVPYIAIDMKQERVIAARKQGFPVFFGDASRLKVLQAAGADHAKMLVIALEDPQQVSRLVTQVRQYYADMPIHARARDRQHCADLIIAGATTTVSDTLETSLRLTEEVLLGSGLDPQDVKRVINEFREDYYQDVVKKVTDKQVVMGELRH